VAYLLDKKKSLKVLLENSLNSKLFRSLYFFVGGKSKDVLEKGDLSCAFYVSVILKILGLIENLHTTVHSTLKDLEKSGWFKTKKPKFGAIILWEPKKENHHSHLGFYVGKNKAISNSSKRRTPSLHNLNCDNRKILSFYFHKSLK
jgi:hypothetical protein